MPYQEPNYEAAFSMDMTGVPGALEALTDMKPLQSWKKEWLQPESSCW